MTVSIDKKEIRFITKLIEKTNDNSIKWKLNSNNYFKVENGTKRDHSTYYAQINGKTFRIYEYLKKYYYDEENFDISKYVKLEMIDLTNRNILYDYSYYSILDDLISAVKRQTSSIDNFMDDFLGDDVEEKEENGKPQDFDL